MKHFKTQKNPPRSDAFVLAFWELLSLKQEVIGSSLEQIGKWHFQSRSMYVQKIDLTSRIRVS